MLFRCVIQYYFVIVGVTVDPRSALPGDIYLYMKLQFHPYNSVCFLWGLFLQSQNMSMSIVVDCMTDDVDCVTVFAAPNESHLDLHSRFCEAECYYKEWGLWLWYQMTVYSKRLMEALVGGYFNGLQNG